MVTEIIVDQLLQSPSVYLTSLFVLGITAQWLAWRFRVPAILLLLGFGFAANNFVDPTQIIDSELLFPLVSLSVAVILFDGGLSLSFSELKTSSLVVTRLVTVGCAISWILGTLAARLVFDSWWISCLAGAIYTVTGPTVVGPLLRHIRPNPNISSIAKWEGIVIDPIGALLAVLVSTAIDSSNFMQATWEIVVSLSAALAISSVVGITVAMCLVFMIRKHLIPDYLQNPIVLMSVLASYTVSNLMLPESGLGTVTVLGIAMANQKSISVSHLIEFKENLGVLLISVLFILMASRYEFATLLKLGTPAVLFLLLMIFVVRPLSVAVSTIGTSINWKERLFLAFLAPRGIVAAAVASVFALELRHLAHEGHSSVTNQMIGDLDKLVPLTFVVIVGTVAFYGLLAGPLARYLKISERDPQGFLFGGADYLVRSIAAALQKEGFRVLLVDTNYDNIRAARMQNLPATNASILSDFAREELDLAGIGRFVAMTANDQVNRLATLEFKDVFETSDLFQLKPDASEKHRKAPSQQLKRSRYIFKGGTTHRLLDDLVEKGFVVKTTRLTPEFPYASFQEKYGPEAVLMFIISETRKLEICTDETTAEPPVGATLIALVPKLEKNAGTSPPGSSSSTETPSVS